MKSRVAATCVCTAAFALLACSSSDTLIALNVESASGVGLVSKLHVTVKQGTKTPFEKDFSMLPTKQVGAAGAFSTVIADKFYERFTLPSSFSDGKATLDVEAFDAADKSYLHPEPVEFEVHKEEATAVFVKLAIPTEPPPPPPEGGAGGEGGAAATGGTSNGGTTSGGTGGHGGAADAGAGGAR